MASSRSKKRYQNDSKWVWKLTVRCIGMVLALVGITISGWVMGRCVGGWTSGFGVHRQFDMLFLPWIILTLGLSFCWNLVNVLRLLHRSQFMPFKINATFDFLLWKGNLIAAVWLGVAGAINLSDGSLIQYDRTFRNWYTYQWDNDPRYGFSYSKGVLEITTTGLAIVVFAIHLALFIAAIHTRRRARRTKVTPLPNYPPGYTPRPPSPSPYPDASPSPLPYPNPAHPTTPYAPHSDPPVLYTPSDYPIPSSPVKSLKYQHQASPSGVHDRERKTYTLLSQAEEGGMGTGQVVGEEEVGTEKGMWKGDGKGKGGSEASTLAESFLTVEVHPAKRE